MKVSSLFCFITKTYHEKNGKYRFAPIDAVFDKSFNLLKINICAYKKDYDAEDGVINLDGCEFDRKYYDFRKRFKNIIELCHTLYVEIPIPFKKGDAVYDKFTNMKFKIKVLSILAMSQISMVMLVRYACNVNKIRKTADIPLFFIAGSEDPVGQYGKGVMLTYDMYNKLEFSDLSAKLFACQNLEFIGICHICDAIIFGKKGLKYYV